MGKLCASLVLISHDQANESYRLRLINSALDTTFKFGIDNHTLTVISNDLVPIVPYETDFVTINIGQRYDVVVTADQDPANYWIRALVQNCSSGNAMTDNITGIFNYDSVPLGEPSSVEAVWTDSCADELPSDLVPYLALDVGEANVTDSFDIFHDTFNSMSRWTVNDVEFYSEWRNPSKSISGTADAVVICSHEFGTADTLYSSAAGCEWSHCL